MKIGNTFNDNNDISGKSLYDRRLRNDSYLGCSRICSKENGAQHERQQFLQYMSVRL